MSRYMDTRRMQVRPAALDDLSSAEVIAFRVIDMAIHDVQRREAEAEQRKKKREDKKRERGGTSSPRMSTAQVKARSAGKRAARSSKRR